MHVSLFSLKNIAVPSSALCTAIHNQAIAEELAQEVFLRIYRARASYRAEARFTTWLYRIASNTAINHAQRQRMIHNAFRDLSQLPPEQRRVELASRRFKGQFSDHERQILATLMNIQPDLPLRRTSTEDTGKQ